MKRLFTLIMVVIVFGMVALVLWLTLGSRFSSNGAIDIGRMPAENSHIDDISVKFKQHSQVERGYVNNQNVPLRHPINDVNADGSELFNGGRRDDEALSFQALEPYLGSEQLVAALREQLMRLRSEGLYEHWRLDNSAWCLYVDEHLALVLGVEVGDIAKWWTLIADNQDWQALVVSHSPLDSAFWSLYQVRQELEGVYENLYTKQLLE